MKRRRATVVVNVMVTATVALALGLACGKERGDLTRARELIEGEQWANARTALGQVLKQDRRNLAARALLLYSLDREGIVEQLSELRLRVIYGFAAAVLDPEDKSAPQEVRKHVEEQLAEVRRGLFDRGLDTKDARDLAAVIEEAARYAYAHEQDEPRKDAAAAVLAMRGERGAIAHLIDRLKGQAPYVPAMYLKDAGRPVAAPLQAALADPGFTGRRPALHVLAALLAVERARALLEEQPGLTSVELSPAPTLEEGLLGSSELSVRRNLFLWRVHGSITLVEEEAGAGALGAVVVLQAWDDSAGRVYLEAHQLVGGELRRLAVVDQAGAPLALGREVVHRVAPVPGGVELTRRRETSYRVEVDAGRLRDPAPGQRVRLQGYPARGALVREDQGLWLVKLDEPLQGAAELPVAPGSLIAQREEERRELRDEVWTARLEDGRLRATSVEHRPLAKPASP